jgi:hypothetical protein
MMNFLKKLSKSYLFLALLVFLSGMISAYDNVMNVVFYDELPTTEQNPYASWIISKTGVSGLVQIKAIGTLIAVALMLWLIKTKYRFVIIPVFLFQLGLFLYITFYTPNIADVFWGDWGDPIIIFFEFYQGKHRP